MVDTAMRGRTHKELQPQPRQAAPGQRPGGHGYARANQLKGWSNLNWCRRKPLPAAPKKSAGEPVRPLDSLTSFG